LQKTLSVVLAQQSSKHADGRGIYGRWGCPISQLSAW